MSGKDAADELRERFKLTGLNKPPGRKDIQGNLSQPARQIKRAAIPKQTEPTVQLNLRIRESVKKRIRLLAARDGLQLSELVEQAIDLYEEAKGEAPK